MDEKNIITCPYCGTGLYDEQPLWFWRGLNSCPACSRDFCVLVQVDGAVLVVLVYIDGGVL